jgi:two-component system OmpR family response regulator
MMPGEDGLSLCRHIREAYGIPTILLTARTEEIDRIVGLEIGADDYVSKPFNPRELLARIRAVLRRAMAPPPSAGVAAATAFRFNGLTLRTDERVLIGPDGVGMSLSTGEYNLIHAFVTRPRVVLTREQLLDLTRRRTADVFDRSIDNMVSRLRRKIEPDPRNPTVIKTIWGGGYMLNAEVQAE